MRSLNDYTNEELVNALINKAAYNAQENPDDDIETAVENLNENPDGREPVSDRKTVFKYIQSHTGIGQGIKRRNRKTKRTRKTKGNRKTKGKKSRRSRKTKRSRK